MHQINKLSLFPKLFHAFSTFENGNMSYLYGDLKSTNENRKQFINEFKINKESCSTIRLVHGTNIIKVLEPMNIFDPESFVTADAMITNVKGLFLLILAADCLPIILYDPSTNSIGLVHAGWKGVEKKIVQKVISEMVNEYDISVSNLIVGIGPGIRRESYLFDDLSKKFDDYSLWKKYITKIGGNYSVDLVGFNFDQLIEYGVIESNIIDSNIDTAIDERFFSHYRDIRQKKVDQGRFATIVGLT